MTKRITRARLSLHMSASSQRDFAAFAKALEVAFSPGSTLKPALARARKHVRPA